MSELVRQVKQEVDEDDKFENRESENDIAQEDDMKSDKLSEENDEFSMNEEEISKKKRQKYIVESDTDEDDQMVEMEKGDIKLDSMSKSAKHEALKKVLETGERISNRMKNIDQLLEKEKPDKIKINGSDNSKLKDECDTSLRQDMKVKRKHLTKKAHSTFCIPTSITCV
jgi:hypothetical protein